MERKLISEEDMTSILEIARVALEDPVTCEDVIDKLDMNPREADRLWHLLEEYMS